MADTSSVPQERSLGNSFGIAAIGNIPAALSLMQFALSNRPVSDLDPYKIPDGLKDHLIQGAILASGSQTVEELILKNLPKIRQTVETDLFDSNIPANEKILIKVLQGMEPESIVTLLKAPENAALLKMVTDLSDEMAQETLAATTMKDVLNTQGIATDGFKPEFLDKKLVDLTAADVTGLEQDQILAILPHLADANFQTVMDRLNETLPEGEKVALEGNPPSLEQKQAALTSAMQGLQELQEYAKASVDAIQTSLAAAGIEKPIAELTAADIGGLSNDQITAIIPSLPREQFEIVIKGINDESGLPAGQQITIPEGEIDQAAIFAKTVDAAATHLDNGSWFVSETMARNGIFEGIKTGITEPDEETKKSPLDDLKSAAALAADPDAIIAGIRAGITPEEFDKIKADMTKIPEINPEDIDGAAILEALKNPASAEKIVLAAQGNWKEIEATINENSLKDKEMQKQILTAMLPDLTQQGIGLFRDTMAKLPPELQEMITGFMNTVSGILGRFGFNPTIETALEKTPEAKAAEEAARIRTIETPAGPQQVVVASAAP
jgi:hypothetical protein